MNCYDANPGSEGTGVSPGEPVRLKMRQQVVEDEAQACSCGFPGEQLQATTWENARGKVESEEDVTGSDLNSTRGIRSSVVSITAPAGGAYRPNDIARGWGSQHLVQQGFCHSLNSRARIVASKNGHVD